MEGVGRSGSGDGVIEDVAVGMVWESTTDSHGFDDGDDVIAMGGDR